MRRNQSLDSLRGIAILLVVLFHAEVPVFSRIGWIGVDLFFVLSGFLISGLLFQDYERYGRLRLGRFWLRRAFKILPPLYIFLASMALVLTRVRMFSVRRFAPAIFFYVNYLDSPNQIGSVIAHTWSLAVEEHFYLTCPVLLWLLIKYGKKADRFHALPFIFVLMLVACSIFRYHDHEHYAYTHLRVDALFAGVTLRYIERFRAAWFRKLNGPVILVLGLTFFVIPFTSDIWWFVVSWNAVSGACLVAWCYSHDGGGLWVTSPMRELAQIGFCSYSIYLWQQPVCMLFKDAHPAWFFKSVAILFSVIAGVSMTRSVELPALALRDRITARSNVKAAVRFAIESY